MNKFAGSNGVRYRWVPLYFTGVAYVIKPHDNSLQRLRNIVNTLIQIIEVPSSWSAVVANQQ